MAVARGSWSHHVHPSWTAVHAQMLMLRLLSPVQDPLPRMTLVEAVSIIPHRHTQEAHFSGEFNCQVDS